jgi:hypothetical protein
VAGDADDQFEGSDDTDDLGHGHTQEPEVDARVGAELGAAEGRVVEPSSVGHRTREQAPVQEDATEQVEPVSEGVQAGEGEIPAPDHHRDQVHRQPLDHGHGEEEHHRRAVKGEGLVVGVWAEEALLGADQLCAYQRSLQAPDEQEYERGDDEPEPDGLVVHVRQPADEPRRRGPRPVEIGGLNRRPGVFGGRHVSDSM